MRAATRLWLSATILLLLLAAFCFVLVSQFGTDRQTFVVVTVAGASVVGLVIIGTTVLSLRALERRRSSLTRALNAMSSLDGKPVVIETSDPDLAGISSAFNDMSERLWAEAARREKAEEMLNLIRRLADRLPGCLDDDEFASVIQNFAPQLTGDRAGNLYLLNDSRNLLRSGCAWNNPRLTLPEFSPDDCWGLRRGQEHISGSLQVEVECPHILREEGMMHWCMPLVARGETVGLLYLEGRIEDAYRRSGHNDVVYMLRETVGLGLVNLRLREKLRVQSVRDPLTGLYNRRYLDESLELELARASRSQSPVAAIMMDIDHFKKFNDTFGHEAGDAVLKAVANVLGRWTRKGDVAGRFGGEEFLLLMPGVDVAQAVARAESMRAAISALDVMHGGQKLGSISASFGVATYPADGDTCELVIESADKSLYAAKSAGRNRVVASFQSV